MRWIVTGGAGFIGSELVRRALAERWADRVIVLDALTYSGNLENLATVRDHPGLHFIEGDITDAASVDAATRAGADALFHCAAESHVDRSLTGATDFVSTNVLGTQVLLDAARRHRIGRFVHVSTDEVYGSLTEEAEQAFDEQSPLAPSSPYAASKAAADLLVLAAHRSHAQDVVITRSSNNYGPYQYPEKLIPLFVTNALQGQVLPLYGDGLHVRDWLHVSAHVAGLRAAFQHGTSGAIYNLGGGCERKNADIAGAIAAATGLSAERVVRVADRPGHDRRYALCTHKARRDLQFDPGPPIESRLAGVIDWYRTHAAWWQPIKAGEFRNFYASQYGDRIDGARP